MEFSILVRSIKRHFTNDLRHSNICAEIFAFVMSDLLKLVENFFEFEVGKFSLFLMGLIHGVIVLSISPLTVQPKSFPGWITQPSSKQPLARVLDKNLVSVTLSYAGFLIG